MRWRSIEISFLTLDCHLWWNAKIQKSILSMKCQIYYNYEDESWPSGSQERRKDRLLCWSILHVPCSLAANLRAILVQGVFRHYVSPCRNKFLLEYLTLESDNNTGVSAAKRLGGFGNTEPGGCGKCAKCRDISVWEEGWATLLRSWATEGGWNPEIPATGGAPALLCAGGTHWWQDLHLV